MCKPPLTEKSAPVAKPDSSEATHDTIDAMSQGTNRLLLMPLTAADDLVEPDVYEEADLRGYAITPY